jgi:hypothetical protein
MLQKYGDSVENSLIQTASDRDSSGLVLQLGEVLCHIGVTHQTISKRGVEVEMVYQNGRFSEPIKKRFIVAQIALNVVRKTGSETQSSIIFTNLEFIEPLVRSCAS